MRAGRALLVMLAAAAAATAHAHAQAVDVAVQLRGERIIVDVTAHAPVSQQVAWGVLTDYEHMAAYVKSLTSSKVLGRRGNRLEVEQSGEVHYGFVHYAFTTVRSVELLADREIRSQLLRGDFKSYEFRTRLATDPAGKVTIAHHGEYVPNRWVPPVVGPALIEAETRRQYEQMVAEMEKREAASAAPRR